MSETARGAFSENPYENRGHRPQDALRLLVEASIGYSETHYQSSYQAQNIIVCHIVNSSTISLPSS